MYWAIIGGDRIVLRILRLRKTKDCQQARKIYFLFLKSYLTPIFANNSFSKICSINSVRDGFISQDFKIYLASVVCGTFPHADVRLPLSAGGDASPPPLFGFGEVRICCI